MNDITLALRRRWILVVLGAVLAVGAGLLMFSRTPPTYTYSATTLMLPPKITTQPEPGSTDYARGTRSFYLGSLSQARDILIGDLTSKNVQAAFDERFPGTSYTVAPDALNSSPEVVLTTEGTSDTEALAALKVLDSQVPGRLASLQKRLGVVDNAYITASSLNVDSDPTVSHKAQIRKAILAAGAVGLLTLFGVAAADSLLTSRRRRGGNSAQALSTEPDSDIPRTRPAPSVRPAKSAQSFPRPTDEPGTLERSRTRTPAPESSSRVDEKGLRVGAEAGGGQRSRQAPNGL